MTEREIEKVYRSHPTMEGAGVLVKRAFGVPQGPELDPFLLLDEFRSENPENYRPGFPFHPHRGIETITYVLHGGVEHQDSLGNKGTIGEGDVQWMTAGSGIIHQEMLEGDQRGYLQGYQLWINLPATHKMIRPVYRAVKAEEIPLLIQGNGVTVRVICGNVRGVQGPVRDIVTNPDFLDITLPPDLSLSLPISSGYTAIAYPLEGNAYFDAKREPFIREIPRESDAGLLRERLVGEGYALLYTDGDRIRVQARSDGVRFLLMAGKPLLEPIAWRGPVVMNTEEELETAFTEYRNGTFVKYRGG